jgi:hypothetical protein
MQGLKGKLNTLEITPTNHAVQRFQQRSISEWAIGQLVQFGDCIYKQGMRFYYMRIREIERFYTPEEGKELKDLVVLMTNDMIIITAYRNPNGVHAIKRKGKRLAKVPKYWIHNKYTTEFFQGHQKIAA